MADLHAIYNELGLSGLVPHALKPGSRGNKMLTDKIKTGSPIYFIRTQMNTPYLVVKDGTYQATFYTTQSMAEQQATALADAGYHGIMVEDVPDGQARKEVFLWLFDHGPTAILIDDSLSLPLKVLVPELPTYDGRPNEEHMLRNRALNGATFYFLQQAAAGYGNMEAEQQWAKSMYHGELIVPVTNDAANGYPILSTKVNGKTAFLVYSDWRQLGYDFDGMPSGIVSDYDALKELLRNNPDSVLLFNKSSCHLVIDADMLDSIRQIAIGQPSALSLGTGVMLQKARTGFHQTTEENWDKVDPTPDFLK